MKTLPLYVLFALVGSARCASDSFCRTICYEEVVKAVKNNTLIIDVRPKQEVADTGLISGSINIPLQCLRTRLEVPRAEFKDDYGRAKPKKHDLIIVTGRPGATNPDACEVLCFLGYKKVRDYVGGLDDWLNKQRACMACKPSPPPTSCEIPECPTSKEPPPPLPSPPCDSDCAP